MGKRPENRGTLVDSDGFSAAVTRQTILVEDQPGLRLSVAGIPDQIRSWLRERDQRILEVIPLAIMTSKNNPLLSRDIDPPVRFPPVDSAGAVGILSNSRMLALGSERHSALENQVVSSSGFFTWRALI